MEWVWQGEDEEEDDEDDEEECDASFVVVQAFDTDSNAIANELFVYVLGYNEDNDFFWDFGDEGLPAQIRFPLGTTKPTGLTCFASQ